MIDFHLLRKNPKTLCTGFYFGWLAKYWFQIIASAFLLHIYFTRDVHLVVYDPIDRAGTSPVQSRPAPVSFDEFSILSENALSNKKVKWKSSDFKNLSFILNPGLAERKRVGADIVSEKQENCRKYVERFAKSAIVEMEKYGIPASITLAQGLLESDAGDSRLAKESNNHFGIKCRRKCRGCTCRNYSDDDVYDMFRVFDSAWDSYREHSALLQIKRYSHLKKLGTKDYENWAVGLKKAGYATDKNYHKKLIRIIETLDLQQFDK